VHEVRRDGRLPTRTCGAEQLLDAVEWSLHRAGQSTLEEALVRHAMLGGFLCAAEGRL
jgi:hypothetical protein